MAQPPVALANPLSEKFAVDAAEPAAGPRRRAQPQSPPRPARRPPLRDRHALLAARRNARRRRSRGWASARRITGAARGGRSISPTSRASSNSSRRSRRSRSTFAEAERAVPRAAAAPRAILINGTGDRRPRPAVAGRSAKRAICRPADEVYVAEIDLDARDRGRADRDAPRDDAAALPVRRPRRVDSRRDTLSAETVRGTIRSAAPDTLIQVREFDRYQGKGIPDGKVSLSFRLTFQSPERTLTDDEVQAAMQRIIDALTRELQAVQR